MSNLEPHKGGLSSSGNRGDRIKLPSPKVRAAIAALITGEATTQTEAAKLVGLRRESLTKALNTQRSRDYIVNQAKALRTSDLLPLAFRTIRAAAKEDADVAMAILKEDGVVSRAQGLAQVGAAGGVSLSIVVNQPTQDVDSGPVIDVSASHNADQEDPQT